MIETTRFEGNEIITTGDANNTATRSIENLDFAFEILGDDQIVYGLEVTQTGTPSMGVAIAVGMLFDNANNKFLRKNTATTNLSVTAADATLIRRDIVEIRRQTVDFSADSRQFKDPETKVISTLSIDTKVQYDVEVKILAGTPGNNAPAVESGWKKIAEIHVPASVTTIINSYIKNCDAPVAGEVNTSWTTGATSIHRQGTLSELKQYVLDSIPEAKKVTDLVERTTLSNDDQFYVVNPSGATPEQVDLRAKISTLKTKITTDLLTGTTTKLAKFKSGGGVEDSLTISDVVVGSEVTGTAARLAVFKTGGRGVENGAVHTASPTNATIMSRDSSGRSQVAAPLSSSDIARLFEVLRSDSSSILKPWKTIYTFTEDIRTTYGTGDGVIFVGVSGGGIYRSTDDGVTFSHVLNTTDTISKIIFHNSTYYVAVGNNASNNGVIYRSTDGVSWGSPVTIAGTTQLIDVATDNSNIVAISSAGSYRSTDSGASFGSLVSISGTCRVILCDGSDFAVGTNDIITSSTDGVAWTTRVTFAANINCSGGLVDVDGVVVIYAYDTTFAEPVTILYYSDNAHSTDWVSFSISGTLLYPIRSSLYGGLYSRATNNSTVVSSESIVKNWTSIICFLKTESSSTVGPDSTYLYKSQAITSYGSEVFIDRTSKKLIVSGY